MADADPMRIAHVSLHTDPYEEPGAGDVGGMNVLVRHVAEAMAVLGHEVEILTRRSSPSVPTVESPVRGVTVRRLAAGPAVRLPKGEHEVVLEEFSERLAGQGPVDVVHAHHWFSGVAALPVARRWAVPLVQTFHSIAADPSTALSHGERPESPGRLAGEALLGRDSDAIVAVSHAEAATAVERLGASPARVVVVRPGVDVQAFAPGVPGAAGAPAAPGGEAYVMVAARLEPLKGIDLAIEALAAMPDAERPILVVVGGETAPDGRYLDELVSLARRLGVESLVRFVGPLSRASLAAALRGARALLVPSHSETYGLVALEAAASGIPVIAAATGGLREAVVDGVTGLMLDSRDPGAWARAIGRVVGDRELAGRLGRAGREHAVRHTWDTAAARMVAVYRRLVARPADR